jgi:hypothetical protein
MGNPILSSSDLSIIGENRWSRKWVNKREGPKIVLITYNNGLRLHLTKN